MAQSNAYIFSMLEKFSDCTKMTLGRWLWKFDICCTITKKEDSVDGGPIKGQLLLLYVDGRARAILEEFEDAQGGVPQTYDALTAKLKEHFESDGAREEAIKKFETRVQKVDETEEEFIYKINPGLESLNTERMYSCINNLFHFHRPTHLSLRRQCLFFH